MREQNSFPTCGIILIVLLILSLCALVVLGAIFLFGFSLFSGSPISVGPTFTSPSALAADVVYETTFPKADAGSIVFLEEETSGEFAAVLIGYIEDGEAYSQLILTRRPRAEYLVENGRPGRSSASDDFRVETHFVDVEKDTYVAVSGEISNPDVAQIEIIWAEGSVRIDTASAAPFHTFLWFGSPAGDEPQPHTLRALDEAGEVISAVAIGP
jgi:hypothetical protein